MDSSAIRSSLPYFVGLAVAALLYFLVRQIEYAERPGMLGPDFWPTAAILLMATVCVFEILRAFAGMRSQAQGIAEVLETDDSAPPALTYPRTLVGGIVLVVVYAVVVDVIGFLLSTFLFLVAFMYLGRYRNHAVIWIFSTGAILLSALIFMRFAYVSLPRGWPPFDAVTDFVRIMLGG
ncbi:MAG: tripartite tricarboxylate transporter TctB family protein [Rhizobiales bacterium]|nr:tripartite tricarboxylate transporter TctB family protein [Hyphomicrobiales bacterium]